MRRVRITIGPVELQAKLFDTPAADAIYDSLPLISKATVAAGRIRFATPARGLEAPAAAAPLKAGELDLSADCGSAGIDFTIHPYRRPARRESPIPRNVWGRALGDIVALKHVLDGDRVTIRRVD